MERVTRITLIVLAVVGIALIITGAVFASMVAKTYIQAPEALWSGQVAGMYFEGIGLGALVGFALGLIGIMLALVGGLITKPRSLWFIFTIAGLVYLLPFIVISVFVTYKHHSYPERYPDSLNAWTLFFYLVYFLPGILAIIEGLMIRKPRFK